MNNQNFSSLLATLIFVFGSFYCLEAQTKDEENTLPRHFIQIKTALTRGASTLAPNNNPPPSKF